MKWKIINFIETTKHKAWVAWYLFKVCCILFKRAIVHDFSKYGKHERPYFEKALPKLKGLTYGSDEYRQVLREIKPAVEHHYKNNSHHPEFHDGTLNKMGAIDHIEMLCDWAAASKRHEDGSLVRSLRVNADRFYYTADKFAALLDDAQALGLVNRSDLLEDLTREAQEMGLYDVD